MSPSHVEWLRRLERGGDAAYRELLRDSADLSVAAFTLAVARCMTYRTPTAVPSRTELHVAAREIFERAGAPGMVPSAADLAAMAAGHGLSVIVPLGKD